MPLLSLGVKYNCVCIGAMESHGHKVPGVDEILRRQGHHRHSSQLGFCIFFSGPTCPHNQILRDHVLKNPFFMRIETVIMEQTVTHGSGVKSKGEQQ